MLTSEAGRRFERLTPTQNKQSCHVPTIELLTKDVSPEVTQNAALIKTGQAEFRRKLQMKTFPLWSRSAESPQLSIKVMQSGAEGTVRQRDGSFAALATLPPSVRAFDLL